MFHNAFMERSVAIARLKPFEARLRERGVSALYLFGSTARNEAQVDSDLDLLFEHDPKAHFTLFSQAGIMQDLSEQLGAKVDLIARDGLRPHFRAQIERDMVKVF
ncbi:nucleotidyltransferase domain-containing protein [Asticcacaulis sp. EMRT-3]|uniref:nucleotidyltransferase family protein n=1 Tax=Asticcacaulis sp. EMRT-3 TaxID=3040349 RepID=UPI0024AF5126|nr:nucleotidyltransferase domain-containing protein [Asticcacaulis sp. EMRT-3]MDI7776458.1 nucleotidyltransferase domain-containing protein [Asticcacaulis sp. EMRT-3]